MKWLLSFLLIAIPQLGVAATDASTAERYVERMQRSTESRPISLQR
jgi:hypothetical protein